MLSDSDMEEIRRLAHHEGIAIGEWVRRALDAARARESPKDSHAKLKAIRKASRYTFPTAEIEDMLAEIERGYTG